MSADESKAALGGTHLDEAPPSPAQTVEVGEVPSGPRKLVIESLGTGSPRLRVALQQLVPLSDEEAARRLLQAPSVLLAGVDAPLAEAAAEMLRQAGLQIAVLDADAPFEAGKRCAEAVVDAMSKLEVLIALAGDVERVWVWEFGRISICRCDHNPHHIPLLHRMTRVGQILTDPARRRGLHRAIIAQ